MTCCQCQGIEGQFDARVAARDLRRYRRRGPDRTTRMLLDALRAPGVDGMTLLDIGGGVGPVTHELLEAGVRSAALVEASSAYLAQAADEAKRRGTEARVALRRGDFVALAPELEPADIVTLDRVICCYHDMEGLVSRSAALAKRFYGAVYPRDAWWVRLGLAVVNRFLELRKSLFRTYVHPTIAVDAAVRRQGLEQQFTRNTFIWQVVVYAR